jgi:hypothetical protein
MLKLMGDGVEADGDVEEFSCKELQVPAQHGLTFGGSSTALPIDASPIALAISCSASTCHQSPSFQSRPQM